MPELERMELLFERGRIVQRIAVINSLPGLFADHGSRACTPLLEKASRELSAMVSAAAVDDEAFGELPVALAKALTALLEAAEPPPVPMLERVLLPMALTALEKAELTPLEESSVGAEWLHMLLHLLRTRRLPIACLNSTVLPFALRRGDVSAPVGHRLLCTHVMGALATAHPDAVWIQQRFLSHALSMCQDTELRVRCSMCEQLQCIAAALPPEVVSSGPLAEALELTMDEHPGVRAAAFECGTALLGSCDASARATVLEPALRRVVAPCLLALDAPDAFVGVSGVGPSVGTPPEEVLQRVAASLPKLFERLHACGALTDGSLDETRVEGVTIYERLVEAFARSVVTEHRLACVDALVAYASAMAEDGGGVPRRFSAIMRLLHQDAELCVRRALSASHVPVAVSLGPSGAAEAVLPLALSVLEREDPEVLLPLLGALPDLLALLAPLDAAGAASNVPAAPGCPSGYALGSQLLPLLLNLEMPITARPASWRGSLTLLEQFGALTAYLEPGTLYSLVLPVLFGRLTTEAAAPVRLQAARVICLQLRRLRTASQRSEVCSRLVSQLGCAEAFSLRLLFTSVCGMLLVPRCPYGCSRAFFKAHHLHTALLNLASDPVPNVRLRVCELLPYLKRALRLPADADALQRLHHAVIELQSDSARDVRLGASKVTGLLRELDMSSDGSPLRRDSLTSTPTDRQWEADDAARLGEEEALARSEHEALAESRRRAADELSERARAAYARKVAAVDTGALGRTRSCERGDGRRASRDLDPGDRLAAMAQLGTALGTPATQRSTCGGSSSSSLLQHSGSSGSSCLGGGAASQRSTAAGASSAPAGVRARLSRDVGFDPGMGHLAGNGSSGNSGGGGGGGGSSSSSSSSGGGGGGSGSSSSSSSSAVPNALNRHTDSSPAPSGRRYSRDMPGFLPKIAEAPLATAVVANVASSEARVRPSRSRRPTTER